MEKYKIELTYEQILTLETLFTVGKNHLDSDSVLIDKKEWAENLKNLENYITNQLRNEAK